MDFLRLKSKDWLSMGALVLANLVPVGGVIFGGWNAQMIVVLYWMENLVIALWAIPRMAMATRIGTPTECEETMTLRTKLLGWHGREDRIRADIGVNTDMRKVVAIPFFCFSFGLFSCVHGAFLHGWVSQRGRWWGVVGSMVLPAAALIVSHGVSFVRNYVVGREYESTSLYGEWGRPWPRLILLHLVIIPGMLLSEACGSPVVMLAAIVGFKIALDVKLHVRAHQLFDQTAEQEV